MPYDSQAWLAALSTSNLFISFPNLAHNIHYGSPIGKPPPLSKIFLPKNLPSTNIHPEIIDQKLLTEVAAGQMSGPFSVPQTNHLWQPLFSLLLWASLKKCLVMVYGE